jgi:histidinol dehydrogenase
VGPGGSFVTTAKSLVSDITSIDMIAGPTELCIIADETTNPNYVVYDLFSQAEHSNDTFCYVITTSPKFAMKLNQSIKDKILKANRKNIIQQSLSKNGFIALCKTKNDVIKLVSKNGFIALCKTKNDVIKLANKLAPEHLQIITKNPQQFASKIKTAGLVLIGKNTPSAASDYLLGSNHILPTNGFGKVRGSLSVLDFVKLGTEVESSKAGSLSVLDFVKLGTEVESSKAGLRKIAKFMKALSEAEGLKNHYESVRSRL